MAVEQIKFGKFIRGLYRKSRGKKIPLRAMLELTYKCNHKCQYCYNPKTTDEKELSTAKWCDILTEIAGMGTLSVAFTGGEIFTRPDILDIIRYARKLGLRVSVMTNGSLITDELAEELVHIGMTQFEISFLGADADTFDSVSLIPGSFNRVIRAIKILKAKNVIPKLKTCVTSINIGQISLIAELAYQLGVSFSYSPLVIPKVDLCNDPTKFRIEPSKFLDLNRTVCNALAEKSIGEMSKNITNKKRRKTAERLGFWEREKLFNCMAGSSGMFINPYGKMKVCLTLPDPSFDVLTLGVRGSWDACVDFADNLKPPEDWECYTCQVRDWCSWCPGRGYLNTGDIFGCPAYFKSLAYERDRRFRENKAKNKQINK